MSQQRLPFRYRFYYSVAALLGLSGIVAASLRPAIAQVETTLSFQPPPMGTPGNREAGGGRSDTCADTANTVGMMALVPETNVGLTVASSPDLFTYIPPNNAETAELRIFKEATQEEIFAGEFTLPKSPTTAGYTHQAAIVELPLATIPVTLEPGEAYIWAVLVVCDRENRAADIVVDVVVQQADEYYLNTLPTDIATQLTTLDSAAKADQLFTYGAAGLWHDLLSELADLVIADPETYKTAWTNILTSQGMGAIAEAPVYAAIITPLAAEQPAAQP